DINIPITNTRNGIKAGVIQLSVEFTTYSAVPSTSVTVPIDQASTIIISAGSIVVMPAKIVSSMSLNPTRCNSEITIPTKDMAKAAQVNASATSVSASASIIVLPSAPPPVYQSPHIPTATSVTKGTMKNQTLPPSFLKGSPKSSSTEESGVDPFSINSPVVSARCSAFAIGPKSLPITMNIPTATKLSNA